MPNKLKDTVIALLRKHPSYADRPEAVCSHIWNDELQSMGIDTENASIMEFLKVHADYKLTPADDICRWWRKVQEEDPLLRGAGWILRQNKKKNWRQLLEREPKLNT